jgi:uncharacterized membrane protein
VVLSSSTNSIVTIATTPTVHCSCSCCISACIMDKKLQARCVVLLGSTSTSTSITTSSSISSNTSTNTGRRTSGTSVTGSASGSNSNTFHIGSNKSSCSRKVAIDISIFHSSAPRAA